MLVRAAFNDSPGRRLLAVALLLLLVAGLLPAAAANAAVASGNPATAVAYAPSGTQVAVGSKDGKVLAYNPANGVLQRTFTGAAAAITGVAYSPDGSVVAAASMDSTIRVWDAKTGVQRRVLQGHEQPALALAISGDGTKLVSGGQDSRILVWELATGRLLQVLGGNTDFVTAVAFSGDSTTVATATRDARIRIWDAASGRERAALRGHTGAVTGLAFSSNSTTLASGSEDATARIWDLPGKKQLRTLKGHQGAVTSVSFGKNGTVASGGADGTVRTWDPATGVQRMKITAGSPVSDVALSPDGSTVVESADNGTMAAFDTKTGKKSASSTLPPPQELDRSLAAPLAATADAAPASGAADLAAGPGGPILLVTSGPDPFSTYYAEILRAEGLNAFRTIDAAELSATTLTGASVVLLGARTLDAGQVSALSSWVDAGGNLVAMRPDGALGGLLGLSGANGTLSEGYLKVDTSRTPGSGIVGETMQFHGTADRYGLDGARAVATLYSDATTATTNPAVTLRDVGTSGGQAAAFTYDLARSIVGTRQGNLGWSGQERDGSSPIRSDDLYYGNAAGDAKQDWVDLDKVAIPQADEQQRLLINLIQEMNADTMPLPRFWYLPSGHKAAVIMTGDDHGNNGTEPRFDQYLAASDPGCSLADWECIRGTSYIYPSTPLSPAKAAAYAQQGFEVGVHISTQCQDWTPASLVYDYSFQMAEFATKYPGVPKPATNRTHCIAWSDWSSQADVSLANGIRLDTNYYYWPPGWVANRPGFFTGSALPMRFTSPTGSMIDVYQSATQLTDESGQVYPYTIDTLLDRALGAEGYYGAFTINAHTDVADIVESSSVVASAKARDVPVITAKQMLDWVDGRNASTLGAMTWTSNQLSFQVSAAAGARNLQTLVPVRSASGVLQGVTRDGSPVSYQTAVVKGLSYAFVPSASGAYVATYAPDQSAPTVASVQPGEGATGVAQGTTVKATFSEDVDPATVGSSTVELRTAAGALVQSAVAYQSGTRSAVLTPEASLAPGAQYTVAVKGGTSGAAVKDLAGNRLEATKTWTFTTATGPACPCSIWPASAEPVNKVDNDPNAVELGVRFRADQDGFISGVRFWKGTQNTGTHTGNLWSTSRQRLATATFTNETASGWQEVLFSTPVAVEAGRTYVASYHTTSGYYAGDNSFFTPAGAGTTPVRALRDGEDGPNGVYKYSGTSTFPTDTWRSSNYWVDVVFTATTGPDTTGPAVIATDPQDGATSAARNAPITATFNEPLDPASVSGSSVVLRGPGASAVTGTVSYDAATRTVSFAPAAQLAASTTYTLTLQGSTAPGITDTKGNTMPADVNVAFTTAQPGVCDAPGNAIVAENCKPGANPTEWDVTGIGDPSIQGFATDISANRGSSVSFKIDTTASAYRIDIYRLGSYGGKGARKVATIPAGSTTPRQQPSCLNDAATGLVDCGNWSVSATWAVPADATSGLYIARPARSDNGGASHIPFVVRADGSTSDVVFQTSDTTWQAYNTYGGNSLYQGAPAGRAYKVSYNRPFTTRTVDNGQDWLFNAEYPMIRWLESNGYDVSYISGVDADRAGAQLRQHKTFLSVGHDEYWSGTQRANVEAARNAGVNLAFLSGNEVFWKTRWETSIDGSGTAHRTLVCYKETKAGAKIDPSPEWTGTWRDPRLSPPADGGRPENALTGQLFMVNDGATTAIKVPEADGKMRLWRNTGLENQSAGATATLPDGTLGYEWDVDVENGFRPAGSIRLSSTTVPNAPVLQDQGNTFGSGTATHAMTLYRQPGGGLVFGAGTVQWSWGLDAEHDRGGTPVSAAMQQATVNLLADMGAQPATLATGMTPATASSDTTAPVATITSPSAGANLAPSTSVTISGTATDSGGRVGAVEVSTDGGTTWRLAAGRGAWSFSFTTPASGTVSIAARAADDSANLQRTPASVSVTVGSPPPPVPTGLVAVADASGATLDWADVPGATGYQVYRSTTISSVGTKINAVPVATSAWVDTQAPSGAVFYRVTAVGSGGGESAASAQASVTVAKANLLANSSFEIDANADGRPDSWTSTSRFTRQAAAARSGGFGGRHLNTANATYNVAQTRTGLVAGQSYTVDGWVNIPATTDAFTFALRVEWRNSSNVVISTAPVASYTAATNGWVRANGTLIAPAGATRAVVTMASTSVIGPVMVDDISMR